MLRGLLVIEGDSSTSEAWSLVVVVAAFTKIVDSHRVTVGFADMIDE